MATRLHRERLVAVVHELLGSGATRVIDLGCGRGELLQLLSEHRQFEHLLGIDIDQRKLADARAALGLDVLAHGQRVQVRYGSFEDPNPDLPRFDAAVLLETIEHVDPGRLSRVERGVFGAMRPRTVLITTPNQEFNILHGVLPGRRRHPGHRFEWTRAQFQAWSSGAAERNGYTVSFGDLGPAHAVHGSSTQIARFALRDESRRRPRLCDAA